MNQIDTLGATSGAVMWCSYDCTGNPADFTVNFTIYGEYLTMNVCEQCIDKFIKDGPK